jgi:hypothetical protein
MAKPSNHETLGIQMQYVREALHDLRDELGKYELLKLDLKEAELGVKSIEKDMKELKDWMRQVQENKENIVKLNTHKNVLVGIFSAILSAMTFFKK